MEQENSQKPTSIFRKKVQSIRRRPKKKIQGLSESINKQSACLNSNKGEQPPSISPRTAHQQAFRNYSTKGLQKGSSDVFIGKMHSLKNNISQLHNSSNYRTILNNTNMSSGNGLKSISTEPTHHTTSKDTRQLLMK